MTLSRYIGAMIVVAVALCALAPDPAAADTRDDVVKAGFVYNFARFASWPNDGAENRQITFCIENDTLDPKIFGDAGDLRVRNVPLRIFTIFLTTSGLSLEECDLLYIRSPGVPMQRLVALARIHNILLVSDTPQFAARGGHVEIFPAAENLRFRVNLRELGRSGVSLSSKVLRLAEIVDGDGRK